jgi:hypothetical protein
MVLTVSFVLLCPRIERLHAPGRADKTSARLDTSNGCQDHTTSPSAIMPLVSRAPDHSRISSIRPAIMFAHTTRSRPPHPIPTSVTIAIRPSLRDETARVINLIWGKREAEYFCAVDSTEQSKSPVICPSGKRAACENRSHHSKFFCRRSTPNKKAPADDADASFVVSRDGGAGQPGPAPCVAVYTA